MNITHAYLHHHSGFMKVRRVIACRISTANAIGVTLNKFDSADKDRKPKAPAAPKRQIYQSETKKYHLKLKDETGEYIDPETEVLDILVILFTKNNNKEVKRMSVQGNDDYIQMGIFTDPGDGSKALIIPLEYEIVKEINPGQLAIQITILKSDPDFDSSTGAGDGVSRTSVTHDLNKIKQAIVK